MVHSRDLLDVLHIRDHSVEVDRTRGELEEDGEGLPEDTHSRYDDQDRDDPRKDRVDDGLARDRYPDGGDDNRH